jgi:hypothetical protein
MKNDTNIKDLLAYSEEEVLFRIGVEIDSSLGIRRPNKATLIKNAEKWIAGKRTILKHKICRNEAINRYRINPSQKSDIELVILVMGALSDDLRPAVAILVAVLVVQRGLGLLCD